jgi:hypothetical protein
MSYFITSYNWHFKTEGANEGPRQIDNPEKFRTLFLILSIAQVKIELILALLSITKSIIPYTAKECMLQWLNNIVWDK